MARRKIKNPLPTREQVEQLLANLTARETARTGMKAKQIGLDVRLYGRMADDSIERIGIGCNLHIDAAARMPFEIVDPEADKNWEDSCARHIADIFDRVCRLERRRNAFDPDRTGVTPPRWAWDIHPCAASILSLYTKIPEFDGSHRIDGEHGRIVELQAAPGVKSATLAYGDGIVQIVSAHFTGGSTLVSSEGRVKLVVKGRLPEVIEASLLGKSGKAIAEQLSNGGNADKARVTQVKRNEENLEITFKDVLLPWDARRRGDEDWRMRRMANEKGRENRHG